MTPLSFNLIANAVPVVLQQGDIIIEADLKEMDSLSRDRYLDKLRNRLALDAEGKPTGNVGKIEGMQTELLVMCLFKKGSTETFSQEEIQAWPATVVQGLFKAAQEINYLAGETPAKNE